MSVGRFALARRTVVSGLCVAACFISFGCGAPTETVPDLVPVTGKVTYQGRPLPGAFVTFIAADVEEEATELNRIVRPAGKTDADGRYELAWGDHPGAPPGKYKLMITAFRHTNNSEAGAESLIPEKYASPKTSELMRIVKEEGDNVINIDLQ